MNVVVLVGSVARTVERRSLTDGSEVASFDLSVPVGTATESVPVAWHDPDPKVGLEAGADLVVVGRVRRRFFRVGGATQSRTEVLAERVVPTRQRARSRAAVGAAVTALDPLT